MNNLTFKNCLQKKLFHVSHLNKLRPALHGMPRHCLKKPPFHTLSFTLTPFTGMHFQDFAFLLSTLMRFQAVAFANDSVIETICKHLRFRSVFSWTKQRNRN